MILAETISAESGFLLQMTMFIFMGGPSTSLGPSKAVIASMIPRLGWNV